MVAIFKERNTFQVVVLVLLAVAVKVVYLLHPPVLAYVAGRGLLAEWLMKWYAVSSWGLMSFLALLLNLACALFANAVLNQQRMFTKNNLLTAMGMVLMSSFFPVANTLSVGLVLLPLVIWIYAHVADLMHCKNPKTAVFNLGLAVGFGTVLYHPFIFILAFVFIGLGMMRPFNLREWIVLLMGMLVPFYFILAYDFLAGHWMPNNYVPSVFYSFQQFGKDPFEIISYSMVAVWMAMGFFEWNKGLRRMLIQARKSWNLLLLLALASLAMLFCRTGNMADSFALIVFPLSCFGAYAFAGPKRKFIPALLFWVIAFVVLLTCLHFYEAKI